MFRNFAIAALHVTAACLIFSLPICSLAKETDPGGKDADTEAEIVFEPTSEGAAAAHPIEDEKPIDFDAKRPSILGMTVVEGVDGRPQVVDVGASSPAWDAGIRKDDVILSLHGVQAKSFQEWAEGVRKVVADAKAGQKIPVEVLRDSTPLDLQVRISDQKGNKPPRPVKRQRPNIANNQAPPIDELPIQPGVQPYPVGGGGFGGIGVVDDGVGGTASDAALTRAVAQLMAVNNRAGTAQPPTASGINLTPRANDATGATPGSTGTTAGTFPNSPNNRNNQTNTAAGTVVNPSGVGGQVGTAEFADDAGAMMVSVTLAGLPAGSYRVGIGEFSGGTGGSLPTDTPPRMESDSTRFRRVGGQPPAAQPPGTQPPGTLPPDRRIVPHGGQPNNLNQNPQPGTAPAPTPQTTPALPASGAAPAGGGGTGGTSGGGAAGGGAAQNERPAYRVLAQVAPGADNQHPATSGVNTNTTGATGTPTVVNRNQAGQRGRQTNQTANPAFPNNRVPANPAAGAGGRFGIELGIVTIRPNGGGALQQRLEGIRVASVVGQSVLVVPAEMGTAGGGAAGATSSRQSGATQSPVSLGVVASGVIQMSSTRQRSNQSTPVNQNQNAPVPGTAPGNAVPPAATGTNPNQPVDRNQR